MKHAKISKIKTQSFLSVKRQGGRLLSTTLCQLMGDTRWTPSKTASAPTTTSSSESTCTWFARAVQTLRRLPVSLYSLLVHICMGQRHLIGHAGCPHAGRIIFLPKTHLELSQSSHGNSIKQLFGGLRVLWNFFTKRDCSLG